MEQETIIAENQENGKKTIVAGVPYPIENISDSLATIDKLVAENGTSTIITKEDISRITGKKQNTLVLYFSTYQQYGVLDKVHGKGFLPTTVYNKYREKVYDHHEREALLEIFKKPPLYSKIIDKLNNSTLPSEDKFPTLLKGEPYNVNPNSAERASKIFFENARFLKLLDKNNKLIYGDTIKEIETKTIKDETGQTPPPGNNPKLFKLPIQLPGKGDRTAYFEYPKEMNKRDFKVIAKALSFIASTILIDESNEDYEIEIIVNEKNNKKGTTDSVIP